MLEITSQILQSHNFQQPVWFQIQVFYSRCNLHYEPVAALQSEIQILCVDIKAAYDWVR